MSATESASSRTAQGRPRVLAGVSMHDLLASCAAATAISTPPREPDPETRTEPAGRPTEHREAA
ncbi:hypothetical protein [Streptomyces sp. HUAS ZL42]|uniref:hypothetical protein n=1 Tax=Streptomyces sp. HUAS ZL42 TaxID=3231715 RepID=UPI00345F0AC7